MTYDAFKNTVLIVAISLMFRVFDAISSVRALLAAIFMVFYFPLDYVLIRNFLAFSIVLQVVPRLLVNRVNIFPAIVVIVVASTFHQSAILYGILLVPLVAIARRPPVMLVIAIIFVMMYLALRVALMSLDLNDRYDLYAGNINMFFFNIALMVVYLLIVVGFWLNIPLQLGAIREYFLIVNVLLTLILVPIFDLPILIRVVRGVGFVTVCGMFYVVSSAKLKPALYVFPLVLVVLNYLLFVVPVWSDTMSPLLNCNYIVNADGVCE